MAVSFMGVSKIQDFQRSLLYERYLTEPGGVINAWRHFQKGISMSDHKTSPLKNRFFMSCQNGLHLSRLMGKPTICIGENKDADQLRGNREADQRLCFRYSDSTIPLLLKSEISSF